MGHHRLQRLVQTPSVTGQEGRAQQVLRNLLGEHGVQGTMVPIDEDALVRTPYYQPGTLGYHERPNLVATLRGRGQQRGLLLNSHIDVVTPGDPAPWQADPWSGRHSGGRIYGRGAADAKGCVWAAALAVVALAATDADLRGDIVLESVVDEEETGNGTLELCRRGHHVAGAVVLEPTDFHVCYGHRGVLTLQLTVPGQAGHGATRDGVNAIVKAAPLISAIDALNDDPRGRLNELYAPVTVNIGAISGGIEPYTIAPSCTLTCTVRYPPGAADAVLALLHECAQETAAGDVWLVQHPPRWTTLSASEAAHTDPSTPFVAQVLHAFGEVRPIGPAGTFPATCDARHLTALEHIPTIIFGPGELRAAHTVNESIDVDHVLAAAMMLVHLAVACCS